jgi:hypothetical protein
MKSNHTSITVFFLGVLISLGTMRTYGAHKIEGAFGLKLGQVCTNNLTKPQPVRKLQKKDDSAEADTAIDVQPQPIYQRPRTIAEAMVRNGTLGEKIAERGGVARLSLDESLDVKGTSVGVYDAAFVEAVKARWCQLLENRSPNSPGKVILEFRIHPNGRISDMKMVHNEMTDLLGTICEQAVLDPAPYEPWPTQMRLAWISTDRNSPNTGGKKG